MILCVLRSRRRWRRRQVEAFVFLFSLPAVLFSGFTLARQRLYGLTRLAPELRAHSGPSKALSACMVELRSRQLLSKVEIEDAETQNPATEVRSPNDFQFKKQGAVEKKLLRDSEARDRRRPVFHQRDRQGCWC